MISEKLHKEMKKLEAIVKKRDELNFDAIAIVTKIRDKKLITKETDETVRQIIFSYGYYDYL